MSAITLTCCNKCHFNIRNSYCHPCNIDEDGNVNMEPMVPCSVCLGGVYCSTRFCGACCKYTASYTYADNYNDMWQVVKMFKDDKYITVSKLDKYLKKFWSTQESASIYGRPHSARGLMYYLEDRGLIGPQEKFMRLFIRFPVFWKHNLTVDDLKINTKVQIDGSCVDCHENNFIEVDDICPRCSVGVIEEVEGSTVRF